MPVHLHPAVADEIFPIDGVRIGVAEAGIRKKDKKDLTLFLLEEGSRIAGVFTQNRFCAAPVVLCREYAAASADVRALVINTGNANAGTGSEGLRRARESTQATADLLGIEAERVWPFSTGVIMEPLPVERITRALPAAFANAVESGAGSQAWIGAAAAIMTTDTVPKACSARGRVGDVVVTATGISKGAGMIRPNMATMLGFLATDATVAPAVLQEIVRDLADHSFNRITIDGDTSTNDSFVLIATGKAGAEEVVSLDSPAGKSLRSILLRVAEHLAKAIVRDGEGATKFITVRVEGGKTPAECRQVAYAIAHSPLVKTAFFASDPNLGRILAAIGYAGIADLDTAHVELFLDDVHVATGGGRNPGYLEEDGQRVMKQDEITVKVNLGRGEAFDQIWTCDLSHDYVSINADYRS